MSSLPNFPSQSASSVAEEDIDGRLANALEGLSEIALERNARPKPYTSGTSDSLLYRPVSMEMVAEHLRETFEIKHTRPPYAVLSAQSNGKARRRIMSTGVHTVEVKLRNGHVVPLQLRVQRKAYGQPTQTESSQTETQAQSVKTDHGLESK